MTDERSALAPLREPNFRYYFFSRLVNSVGGVMAGVALAFAVLEVSNSATALGVVLAAHSIPMVVFLLAGGVIADRFGRTLVIQVSNVVGFRAKVRYQSGATMKYQEVLIRDNSFRIGDSKFTLTKQGTAQIKTVMTNPATGAQSLETAYAKQG